MTTTKDKHRYIEAIESIHRLNSAPMIFAKAADLVQDLDTEVRDIVDLIKSDVALTTDIIRLSNSAHYGFEAECKNLTAAINRVGFREVIKLIGLSISQKMLHNDLKHFKISARNFWTNSISMALLMEWTAIRLEKPPQDAYIIGLLHSIGITVCNQIMDDFDLQEIWDQSIPMGDWITQILGFDHTFAGASILKQWNFPTEMCHPILHQESQPENAEDNPLHTLLFFNRQFIKKVGVGFTLTDWNIKGLESSMDMLNLNEANLREIMEEVIESYQTITSNLKPS